MTNVQFVEQRPRNQTRAVRVGRITIGGGAPIAVQSMAATRTQDIEATVRQVTFTLNPLPLLLHKISLSSLEVQDPSVSLLRNREAVNKWTFKTDSGTP